MIMAPIKAESRSKFFKDHLAKSVGTAGKSALKFANWPNWKEIRLKFNTLSESLDTCDDDADDGNDNNKERLTEQHNNSVHATHSSF